MQRYGGRQEGILSADCDESSFTPRDLRMSDSAPSTPTPNRLTDIFGAMAQTTPVVGGGFSAHTPELDAGVRQHQQQQQPPLPRAFSQITQNQIQLVQRYASERGLNTQQINDAVTLLQVCALLLAVANRRRRCRIPSMLLSRSSSSSSRSSTTRSTRSSLRNQTTRFPTLCMYVFRCAYYVAAAD